MTDADPESTQPYADEADADDGPRRGPVRRHPIAFALGTVVVLAVAFGAYVWSQVHTSLSVAYTDIQYTVPDAPTLVAQQGETVYRIDPTRSSVTYGIDEKFAGRKASRATGSTNGIAGDLALNADDPAASRIGKIVVNVEQLHSDNRLRDARIRDDYLESKDHPLATLEAVKLTGLPARLKDGTTYHFTLQSNLTVHGTAQPVAWKVTGTVDGDTLTATATTTVKLSSWDVGPINLAGLVSTSDDTDLTMKLTAVDPASQKVPTEIAAPTGPDGSSSSVSYQDDVEPILAANCASCHNGGEVGAAHWTLDTAGDASKVAEGIATVTQTRYMPPWPASSVGVPLAHSKQMSQKDIDTLAAWAKGGGKLDVPAETPVKAAPKAGTVVKPRHDVVMRMDKGYAGSLDRPNDYRCFVLDPGFTEPTWVTGYEMTPDKRQEIHHSQIFHINAAQAAQGQQLSGSDGKPGWSCYGGPGLRSGGRRTAIQPDSTGSSTSTTSADGSPPTTGSLQRRLPGFTGQPGLIAGWVPGQDPVIYPEHSGILFEPGDAVVLQMHYHYEDVTPVPDRSTLSLQTEPGTAKVNILDIVNPIGPVEIPCNPGATEPLCDRDAALQQLQKEYPGGGGIESALLMLCGTSVEKLAANYHDGVARTTCDYRVPEDGKIVSAMGHMHTLGKSFRLTLDPDQTDQKVLLDIPEWDFDWQMNYGLAEPIHVKAGQVVRMTCTWDRAVDPNRPQKYIVFAEGTEDEMCFSTYAIIPDNP